MYSYWEQQSLLFYDHIVVGSGIVGLSTAIELKQRFPRERVVILERSLLPYGASTRNAGFACMGSVTELLDDLEHSAEEDVIRLYERRKAGLYHLRQRLGDEAIGYRANGSYELISKDDLALTDKLNYLNKLLQPVTGEKAFSIAEEKIAMFGFNPSGIGTLIENHCEGELHTGKMMRSLMDYAMMLGIEIKTGAEVLRFEQEEKQKIIVPLADGTRPEQVFLQCRNLFICTNAFTKTLLPDADVKPGRGQVLITEPIRGLRIKGVFHFDKGYYYFRELDGRILFGGGRQMDFAGETTTEIALHEAIQNDLEEKLRNVILPGQTVAIAQRWSGIMGFAKTKTPVVQNFGSNVYAAFCMGGMGVALGSSVAKDLVALVRD